VVHKLCRRAFLIRSKHLQQNIIIQPLKKFAPISKIIPLSNFSSVPIFQLPFSHLYVLFSFSIVIESGRGSIYTDSG